MKFSDIKQFTKSGTYEVDIPLNYLERTLKSYTEDWGLEMNPDFQRGNVWTEEQQIAYLEFFFRGGKTARVIYFNCPDFGQRESDSDMPNMILVDGLQRLTAFLRFLRNEIPIFGNYCNDFEDVNYLGRSGLMIKFNINDLQYRREVLQWYLDMNTGGTVHSKEEIQKVRQLLEEERIKLS